MQITDIEIRNETEAVELRTMGLEVEFLPGPMRMVMVVNREHDLLLSPLEIEKMHAADLKSFPEMRAFAKGCLARRGLMQ